MPDQAFARHDLLRVDPGAWASALATHGDHDPALLTWAEQGRPLMVRRRIQGEAADLVPVAVALPPTARDRRFATTLHRSAIVEIRRPVSLAVAAATAPASWQATLFALIHIGADSGVEPRIFGSLCWQYETGLTYLTAASDLDLLWDVPEVDRLRDLLRLIDTVAATAPMRIDGEIVLPGGAAVQWRELAGGAERVLVKTAAAAFDCPRALFLAGRWPHA